MYHVSGSNLYLFQVPRVPTGTHHAFQSQYVPIGTHHEFQSSYVPAGTDHAFRSALRHDPPLRAPSERAHFANLLAHGMPVRLSPGMSTSSSHTQSPASPVAPTSTAAQTRAERKAARAERLAAELKSNLRRRKAQARARAKQAAAGAEAEQAGPAGDDGPAPAGQAAVVLKADEPAAPEASHNCAGIVDDKSHG
jgi:hypothetical protein